MGATTERGRSWLEERRRQAWELKAKGWPQNKIAEALGVTEGTVSLWLKRGRRGGVEALRARKRGGSRPALGPEQRSRLLELLERGAEAFGFEGEIWTLPRIAELIRREFGIHYHPAHVSKILRRCGWSPQKPTIRAVERDEAAITAWKDVHRSDAQKAEKRGETLVFRLVVQRRDRPHLER
jgi:transposase